MISLIRGSVKNQAGLKVPSSVLGMLRTNLPLKRNVKGFVMPAMALNYSYFRNTRSYEVFMNGKSMEEERDKIAELEL